MMPYESVRERRDAPARGRRSVGIVELRLFARDAETTSLARRVENAAMQSDGPHPLWKVGSGSQTHALQENRRPLCENVATWTWETTGGAPSGVHDLHERGQPTCHYCRQAL